MAPIIANTRSRGGVVTNLGSKPLKGQTKGGFSPTLKGGNKLSGNFTQIPKGSGRLGGSLNNGRPPITYPPVHPTTPPGVPRGTKPIGPLTRPGKQTKPLPMPTIPGNGRSPIPRNGGTPGYPSPRPTGPIDPRQLPGRKGSGMTGNLQQMARRRLQKGL